MQGHVALLVSHQLGPPPVAHSLLRIDVAATKKVVIDTVVVIRVARIFAVVILEEKRRGICAPCNEGTFLPVGIASFPSSSTATTTVTETTGGIWLAEELTHYYILIINS
jgi:hypothetical protein